MKKKLLATLLVMTMSLSLAACSGSSSVPAEEDTQTEETESIEVDENLLTMEITIPAEYMGETTQEELDAEIVDGVKSITLNEDGSATYVITKRKHKEMMADIAEQIDTGCNDLIGSEDYPNFTSIEANDDYTSFTITTNSTELDLNESFSIIIFYTYGGMYNAFNGTPVDNIHVDFVNATSNEIISSADSKDMAEEAQ